MINLGSAAANKLLFGLLLGLYVALMFRYIGRVYSCGPVVSYIVAAVFASTAPYALVALIWESRVPWPLSGQYACGWANDLFVLPTIVAVLSVMHRSLPANYPGATWWPYTAAVLAIGSGFLWQFVIDAAYPPAVAWSPTHVAHSFVSVVVFVYLLMSGAPGLLFSAKGFRAFAHGDPVGITLCLVVMLGIIAFFLMYPLVDVGMHRYPYAVHTHYNWDELWLIHKMTPEAPGWLPEVLLNNKSR